MSKRFYKVIIGNSQDMHEVSDRIVDLTVTSPPYANLLDYKWSVEGQLGGLSRKDFFKEIQKNFEEVYRVTKPGGKMVLVVGDIPTGSVEYGYVREILLIGDFTKCIENTGFYLISRWFWRRFEAAAALNFKTSLYGNLNNSDPRALSNINYCFVFRKFTKFNEERKLGFTRDEWKVWQDGLWNIVNPVEEIESAHAVYPIELVKRFIKLYTNEGDLVLDCFLGTGTTMRASYELGRSCIGYEIRGDMLHIIRDKVGIGQQGLGEEISWEVVKR